MVIHKKVLNNILQVEQLLEITMKGDSSGDEPIKKAKSYKLYGSQTAKSVRLITAAIIQ